MKYSKKIIGLLLILTLTIQMSVPLAYALTEPEQACAGKKPKYDELMTVWSEAETKDQNAYQSAFGEAQLAHHSYVGCMFDFAERVLLKSDGAIDSGTMDANLLNTGGIPVFSTLIDWMSPDEACLTPDELKRLIQRTEPTQMLAPILEAYADYRDHLEKLAGEFKNKGIISDDSDEALNARDITISNFKRQRELEIQSSLMVIDLMFSSLKELRFSLVMHVQFQCMLQYLEKYRKALEELRNVIEPLPDQLKDASVTK